MICGYISLTLLASFLSIFNVKAIPVFLSWLIGWFVLLFILLLPFPYEVIPSVSDYLLPAFEPLISWMDGEQGAGTFNFSSDSRELYRLTLVLLGLAMGLALLSFLWDNRRKYHPMMWYWCRVGMSYYLALQLFKYGLDKVFKHQFYLPEPNILYTPLGQLSPDILYWSVMGTSYSYSLFAGIIEVIPAFLLLFRRTRLLGALIAFPVLVNVLMINIGFDITVKLFAAFLLFLSAVIISPSLQKLYDFFILNKLTQPSTWQPRIHTNRRLLAYAIAKPILIGLILFECLFGYVKMGNFNDDTVPRPFLHGAYDILQFKRNQNSVPPLLTDKQRWKRIFVHRQGYFIIQSMTGEMKDYQLSVAGEQLILSGHGLTRVRLDYLYDDQEKVLTLKGILDGDTLEVVATQVDLDQLPIFQ